MKIKVNPFIFGKRGLIVYLWLALDSQSHCSCLLSTTKGVCHHAQFHLTLMKPCSQRDIEMDLL